MTITPDWRLGLLSSLTSTGKEVTDVDISFSFAFVEEYGECLGQQRACRMHIEICLKWWRPSYVAMTWEVEFYAYPGLLPCMLTEKILLEGLLQSHVHPKDCSCSLLCIVGLPRVQWLLSMSTAAEDQLQNRADEFHCPFCLLFLHILALLFLLLPQRKAYFPGAAASCTLIWLTLWVLRAPGPL